MGYRSYGQLIFPTSQMDAYHRLAGAAKDNSLDMWDNREIINLKYTEPWHQSQYVKDNDSFTVLDYSGWKWYESYPDIQAIENFMGYLEDQGHSWMFWRKGEDLEDIDIRDGDGYDVTFSLAEGWSQLASIDSMHGWENYELEDSVLYYSLMIENRGAKGNSLGVWSKKIKALKKFMEDDLNLDIEHWENALSGALGPAKNQYLTAKIDTVNYNDRIYNNGELGGDGWVNKLRRYLDKAEIGGSDEQWHLFLTAKPTGTIVIEVTTVHGSAEPWDYDLYPSIDVGWDWSPRKAAPPKSINFRRIVV